MFVATVGTLKCVTEYHEDVSHDLHIHDTSRVQKRCNFVFIFSKHFNNTLTNFRHYVHLQLNIPNINIFIDVSNQQDATTFTFINLFKSALHVSGDKFAHPQEHFLTVCTDLKVPSQLWHWSAAVSVHCTKSCTYSQKVFLRMGEFVARNM